MHARLIGVVVVFLLVGVAQGQDLRAGFGRQTITPTEFETWTDRNGNAVYEPDKGDTFEDANGNGQFDALWIAGFHQGRPVQSVHDDIYALATIVDDGNSRLAIVALDAIGFFHNDVEEVRAQLDPAWKIDHLVIASTHNHEVPDLMGLWGPKLGAPGVSPAYEAFVKKQIVASVGEAVRALAPARMHAAEIPIHDSLLVNDSRPPRVLDPSIRVLWFTAPNGQTLGSILTWANHPETVWSRNLAITSDFAGYFRAAVEQGVADKAKGLGGIHLYINGAIGGLMTTDPGMAIRDPFTGVSYKEPTHEKARALGYSLATAVLKAAPGITRNAEKRTSLEIRKKEIRVPVDNIIFKMAASAGLFDRPMADGTITSEVNLIRVGDVWIATVPGEIYPEIVNGGIAAPEGADFGIQPLEVPPLRAKMRGKVNFVFGLANDEIGYIIPKSQWDQKAPFHYGQAEAPYGEINSPGPETARVVHGALMELFEAAR